MDAEKDRAYWLRERGYTSWKPDYFELTDEQRGWLMVGNIDPADALGRVLDELPEEQLLPLLRAYEPTLGGDLDAYDVAIQMVEDALNMGAGDFEACFPIDPADLDQKVLDILLLWGREEAGVFYE